MNEDPTIPIGEADPGRFPAGRPEAAPGSAWGSFSLLARVGSGGFGEVYRAWDPHLQREVALKLLLPGAVGGEAEYESMLREARALASVRHPNIVQVHGIDRHASRVGFWTDLIHGKTLSVLMQEHGTFGAREAALIGLDVARALSAVHRAGLLHRDIKAENVMREEGGRILLMDFGLSSLDHRETAIAGTPNYMAPELFKGAQSSVATDIYAMGILLYYMVAGEYPARIGGLSYDETMAMFARRTPLIDLRPDLPDALSTTISTAIDIDPAKRFASAGQLANALAECLGTHLPVEPAAASQRTPAKKWKREWIVAAGVLAVAILIGALATSGGLKRLWHHGNDSTLQTGATSDEFQKAQGLLLHSYKQSNVAEAVKGFQAVFQADPANALAEAKLGTAYFAQYGYTEDAKLLQKATDALNHAKSMSPDLAEPYITLARIAADQGQSQLARQYANQACKLEPDSAEAYGALGNVDSAAGRDKDAMDAFEKAQSLAPDDWRWPIELGVAKFKQGDVQGSISELQRGLDLAPDNAVALRDLSIAHMQSGRLDEARMDLEKALQIEPTAQRYSALGSVLLLQQRYDDAAVKYKQAIQLDQDNFEAWANLGNAYKWSGAKREEAAHAFRKAVELGEAQRQKQPHKSDLLASLAEDYAALGNTATSSTLVRQALALSPDDPTVAYRAGETYEAIGQRERAIPLIARALASGYSSTEFEKNPDLASLRSDPALVAALNTTKTKKN